MRSSLIRFLGMLLTAVVSACAKQDLAPDYVARLLGREDKISLGSLRGQVVLLNTWATWCVPCRQEMPAFEALYHQYRGQGMQVVGVNIDEGEADGDVERYVASLGISFPIWRDPVNCFAKRFRVLGVPQTFVISREGMIVRQWRGQMDPYTPDNLKSIQAVLAMHADKSAVSGHPPPDSPTAQRGLRLAEQRDCLKCHSTDGTPREGPSWKDLAGSQVALTDGRIQVRDRSYLTRAIFDPDTEIPAGYAKGLMTGAMPGRKLTQPEIEALVVYIVSLSGKSPE